MKHISEYTEKAIKTMKHDLIAEINGKISINIHASIDGVIKEVTDTEIIIQRNR